MVTWKTKMIKCMDGNVTANDVKIRQRYSLTLVVAGIRINRASCTNLLMNLHVKGFFENWLRVDIVTAMNLEYFFLELSVYIYSPCANIVNNAGSIAIFRTRFDSTAAASIGTQ